MKELNRKLEELEDELKIHDEQSALLKRDTVRIQSELNEERDKLRGTLTQQSAEVDQST